MRKDQRDVIYVMAELNGRTPAEVIADVNADLNARNEGFEKKAWLTRHFFNNGGTARNLTGNATPCVPNPTPYP